MTIVAWKTNIIQISQWVAVTDAAPVGGMTVNIRVTNKNADQSARVDVCISRSLGVPDQADYIEEYTEVERGTPLLETGEPIQEGEIVYVRSDTTGVSVRVSGFNKL
jgi:hypothetical protein